MFTFPNKWFVTTCIIKMIQDFIFPFVRSRYLFILQNYYAYPQTCFQVFRIYLNMFTHFLHMFCDEYNLQSSANIEVYEQAGVFLCPSSRKKMQTVRTFLTIRCKRSATISKQWFELWSHLLEMLSSPTRITIREPNIIILTLMNI